MSCLLVAGALAAACLLGGWTIILGDRLSGTVDAAAPAPDGAIDAAGDATDAAGDATDATDDGITPPMWVEESSGTTENLQTVWGSSPTNVFAAGGSKTIVHLTNGMWQQEMVTPSTSIRSIWGVPSTPGNYYYVAVGTNTTILHGDAPVGTTVSWATDTVQPNPTGVSLNGVWGLAQNDFWAVGSGGTILRSTTAGTWSSSVPSSNTTNNLNGVWGSSASAVYAVGDNATIIWWDGQHGWAALQPSIPSTAMLNAITGESASIEIAGGANILLRNTTTTTPLSFASDFPSSPFYNFYSVWRGGGHTFALSGSHIFHQRAPGASWQDEPLPNLDMGNLGLNAVFGFTGQDPVVYAVGNGGRILKRSGPL